MLGPVHYPMQMAWPMQLPYPVQATIWTFQGCCTQQTGWLKPLSALQFWLKIKVNETTCCPCALHSVTSPILCCTALLHARMCVRECAHSPVISCNTKRPHCTDSMTHLSGSARFFCMQCAACAAEEACCLLSVLCLQGKLLNRLQA